MIGRGTRGQRRGRVDENQHYYTGGAVNLRLCFGCNRVFFQYRDIKQNFRCNLSTLWHWCYFSGSRVWTIFHKKCAFFLTRGKFEGYKGGVGAKMG